MQILNIHNPFRSPVYFIGQCDSTQLVARSLIPAKPMSGTVVTSDYQDKGRGRGTNRLWKAKPCENLLFTTMFHYENMNAIPKAFTLRAGLAVAEAISQFVPVLNPLITVKWPNDVMIASRKASGILAENDGKYILLGIGINLNQLEFPADISQKAISVRQALCEQQGDVSPMLEKYSLLEKVLSCLQKYLSPLMDAQWNALLEHRLFRKDELVSFIPGQADSQERVEGVLKGIGPNGELLINIGIETKSYITGELEYR
jgi:BirA family biotin operon repressor/biotin-[acetyl-CoA-carboxylase] ligase